VTADASHRYQGADNNRLSPYGKDGHAVGSRLGRIFLSHSSVDNAKAIGLARWLEREGWDDYFLDLHPHRGIASGERWEKALNEAAQRCQAVVFLISPAWLASRWCVEELHLAHRLNKQIFGVLVEEVELSNVPAKLRDQWQLVDLARGRDHTPPEAVELPDGTERHVTFSRAGLSRLKAGLTKAEIDARFFAWPPESDPARPPYRGMRPLEMEDAGIFYGREAPVIEVLDRLRGLREAASPRFLALLAASGAGKSSFLRAGLLARLHRDDRSFLPLPIVRPDRAVLSGATGFSESLFQALKARRSRTTRAIVERAVSEGASAVAALMEELSSASVADEAGHEDQSNHVAIVLPIDQAEELFQAEGRTEAVEFLNLLAGLLALPAPKLIALVTIRSDSYERLQLAPELENTRQSAFSLPPLPRGSYQIVIEGPAARLKDTDRPLKIDPALTAALLRDVEAGGAKDSLPLLAFTLERLYARHEGAGELTLKNYLDMGGVGGSISAAVERALLRAADDPALPRQRDAQLALLRRAMIPWLAGIDPDTGSPRRQVARMSEIPEEARPLIRHLITERLLSTDTAFAASDSDPVQLSVAGEATVEPAHEALLRQWSLLDGWLKEDAGKLAALEGVKRATRDWEANARDPSWLAHQAGRLEDAEGLNARPDLAARLDASDRAYLAAARAAETERREKDLAEARKLAEAQRRVAARTRIGAIAALFLAVLAGVAWWQSTQQRAIAVENAQLALQKSEEAAAQAAIAEEQRLEAEKQRNESQTQRAEAEAQADKATKAEAAAKITASELAEQLRQAQIVESRFLANRSREAAANGKMYLAVALALEGLPEDLAIDPPSRPVEPDALSAINAAIDVDRYRTIVSHPYGRDSSINDPTGVSDAAFAPDGNSFVTASRGGVAQLWNTNSGAAIGELMKHGGAINSIAFSPDGNRILTASEDGTARLWGAMSGAAIGQEMKHSGPVNVASFSPDGTRILTASDDFTAQIWNGLNGASLGIVLDQGAEAIDIGRETTVAAFSPDGRRIVTASRFGAAQLWDTMTGKAVGQRIHHKRTDTSPPTPILAAAFSPDGRRVATASYDSTARLWDAATGEPIGQPMEHATKDAVRRGVVDIAFSPDGSLLATASYDETVRVWDAASGMPIGQPMQHGGPVSSVCFSLDGRMILTGAEDRAARLWEVSTGRMIGQPMWSDSTLTVAAFSPDASSIITASDDNTARIWKIDANILRAPIERASGKSVLSADGTRFLSFDSIVVLVWDVKTGEQIGKPLFHEDSVTTAVFSPDGDLVLTASVDKTARLWRPETGEVIGTPMRHDNIVNTAAFSPDGKLILTASEDRSARLWDAQTGALIGAPFETTLPAKSAEFSPDGRLFSVSTETGILVLKVGRDSSKALAYVGNYLNGAVFSADGRYLFLASADGLRVWNTATGELRWPPISTELPINSVALSQDETRLLTSSDDGTARLWNVEAGRQIGPPLIHTVPVLKAIFSHDERLVVTLAADASIHLWEVSTGAELIEPLRHHSRVGSVSFLPGGDEIITTTSLDGTRFWTVPHESSETNLLRARAGQIRTLRDAERRQNYLGPARARSPETLSNKATDCDRLASSPFDPERLAPGVLFESMDGPRAEAACREQVEKHPDEGRHWFHLGRVLGKQHTGSDFDAYSAAVAFGYAAAFYNLAAEYLEGDTVEADPVKARANFEEALRRGVLVAAKPLGRIYWFGNGVEADREKALSLWREAAAKGEPSAHEMLAWVAELGRDGLEVDLSTALYHYAVAERRYREAGLAPFAGSLQLTRASLARNLEPQIVAREWRRAMAVPVSIRP
jgi:WD40 repeat protein